MNPYLTYDELLFSVFDAPLEAVATESLLRFQNARSAAHPQAVEVGRCVDVDLCRDHLDSVEFDLSWAYLTRPASGWQPMQMIFWEPSDCRSRTAMMCNASDGGQPFTRRFSLEVSWECVFIAIRDRRTGMPNSSIMFDYYREHRQVRLQSGIGQEESGRWVFCREASSEALPFENWDYYRRRRIVDRLNRSIVTEYMSVLGYNIASDNFWTTDRAAWLLWDDFNGRKPCPSRRHE